MLNNPNIGQLIQGVQHKDAIHVAVAPMTAAERLFPSQPIFVRDNNASSVPHDPDDRAVGIVDPFLNHPVFAEQRFWLFLYPGTTTPVRHDWEHPAFGETSSTTPPPDPDAHHLSFCPSCSDE